MFSAGARLLSSLSSLLSSPKSPPPDGLLAAGAAVESSLSLSLPPKRAAPGLSFAGGADFFGGGALEAVDWLSMSLPKRSPLASESLSLMSPPPKSELLAPVVAVDFEVCDSESESESLLAPPNSELLAPVPVEVEPLPPNSESLRLVPVLFELRLVAEEAIVSVSESEFESEERLVRVVPVKSVVVVVVPLRNVAVLFEVPVLSVSLSESGPKSWESDSLDEPLMLEDPSLVRLVPVMLDAALVLLVLDVEVAVLVAVLDAVLVAVEMVDSEKVDSVSE